MDVRILFLGFFVVLYNTVNAKQTFKVGEITDNVPVQGSAETFSLYLPSQYDASKFSAIVFIFDPSGNGNGGIQVFKEAAEQFNYILVCSNATRNGIPYEANFASINTLSKTIFSTFKIDEQQIYAAGFSGGARLASTIAVLTNKFQVVIACGATMEPEYPYNPKQNSFSFLSLAGDRDMNYREMLSTKARFDQIGVQNELLIYEDTHSWPPKEQIRRSFEWLELRAYEKQLRSINQENVTSLYKKQYHLADSLRKTSRYLRAVHEFKHLEASFHHLANTDSIQQKIRDLENTPRYQKAKSQQSEILALEKKEAQKFQNVFQQEVLLGKPNDNFAWWKTEFKKLNRSIRSSDIMLEKKSYERVKLFLQGGFYESYATYVYSKDYKRALYCDQLLSILNPKNPYVYYRLSISYARNNDFSNTVKNLRRSKELGLKDFQQTKSTPQFSNYQNRKKFRRLYD